MPAEVAVVRIMKAEGLTLERAFERLPADSDEGRFLA